MTDQPDKFEAYGKVIANFDYQHARAAKTFRDQVRTLEEMHRGQPFGEFFEDIRSYGSACILSAAACLEAFINNYYLTHGGKLRNAISDFDRQFWGEADTDRKSIQMLPILKKYQVALKTLNLPLLDESAYPYIDARLLIKLRNTLVHYKAPWDEERTSTTNLVAQLRTRFATSPFPDEGADFVTMHAMSSGCSYWVVQTMVHLIESFDQKVKIDPRRLALYQKLLK